MLRLHDGTAQSEGVSDPRSDSPLLLSVDFEDWHQLVRRRVGAPGWEAPGPALARQTEALLSLLDELSVRATFFVLGIAARAHPDLIKEVAARGHEMGSHGDAHLPVNHQTPAEFAADLRASRATVEQLTGRRPLGYRAPAFSLPRDQPWPHRVLVDEGFAYDASHHDPQRIGPRSGQPHPRLLAGPRQLALSDGRALWEFPVAVWQGRHGHLRVGGASYWAALPTPVVLHGLRRAGPLAGLYLHPHEFDPQPLDARLPAGTSARQRAHARLRAAQRNSARRRASDVLRAIAERHQLITYGEAHAQLDGGVAPGS